MNDMDELEEMRSQMAALKARLDKEQIINEKLLRASMKQKAGVINRQALISYVAAGFVVATMFCSFLPQGYSLGFCIGTSVFMVFCSAVTSWVHRDVSDEAMSADLLTVAQNVRRLKYRYQQWIKISIPLTILWVIWMIYEMYNNVIDGDIRFFWVLVVCAAIGGTIGGIIGWRMRKKVYKMCDEIVEQIEAV